MVYRLPQTTLFKQLTSFVELTLDVYAAFYGGRLLLAPDEDSLSHYIRQLDKGEVLNGAMAYQTGMDHLSDSYHFMLMADFDHVFRQSEITSVSYRISSCAMQTFSVILHSLSSLPVPME